MDVTESKKAEQALKESTEKILLLMNSTAEGIYGIDLNGCCTFANRTCIEVLGYKSENDFLGNNMHNLIHHSYPDKQLMKVDSCKIYSAFKQGEGTHVEDEVFWRADGTCFPIEYFSYPQFKDDQIIGAVVTFNDITVRKLNEEKISKFTAELIKLNADKDRFMQILAHDLKNPFNLILGFSSILLKNIHNYDIDKIENRINIIHQTTQTTYNLLDDLLLWSKAQSGKLTIEPQKIIFSDICDEIIYNLKHQADSKEISIIFFESEKTALKVDLNMFKTILRNLISNAIKFTDKNGQINIYTEKNHENVTITVSDSGVGIGKENLSKLWNFTKPFSTNGTADEKGTGFGLMLCKEFVEKHDGKIWVESEVGKGSDFKFTMPLSND